MNHFDVRYIINIPYLSDLGKVRTTLVALLGCRVVVFVFSKCEQLSKAAFDFRHGNGCCVRDKNLVPPYDFTQFYIHRFSRGVVVEREKHPLICLVFKIVR